MCEKEKPNDLKLLSGVRVKSFRHRAKIFITALSGAEPNIFEIGSGLKTYEDFGRRSGRAGDRCRLCLESADVIAQEWLQSTSPSITDRPPEDHISRSRLVTPPNPH